LDAFLLAGLASFLAAGLLAFLLVFLLAAGLLAVFLALGAPCFLLALPFMVACSGAVVAPCFRNGGGFGGRGGVCVRFIWYLSFRRLIRA